MKESINFETFNKGFFYYDRTGLQEFFEQKALEGWQLCKREKLSEWTFKRIEPKRLHYAITYLPQFSNEDDFLLSNSKKEYLELCAERGWQFVCTYKNMVIFLNEEADPVPLETDPEVELASIHKSMIKQCLPKFIISLAISIGTIIGLLFSDISSNISALCLVVFLMVPLSTVAEFGSYLRWREKALASAATGIFSRTDAKDNLIVAGLYLSLISAVAIVVVKSLMNNVWETFLYIALIALFCIFNFITDKIKKRCNSSWKKKAVSFVNYIGWFAVIVLTNYIFDMF